MDYLAILFEQFADANEIIVKKDLQDEINSILDSANLDNKAKFRFICREVYSGEKLKSILETVDNLDNEQLADSLDFRFGIEKDETKEHQEIARLNNNDFSYLKESAEAEYDPSKLLTSGDTKNLPMSTKDKFELHDIEDEEIVILSRLLKLNYSQARTLILNHVSDTSKIEKGEVEGIVDGFIWDNALIKNGFYAIVENGNTKEKISLMEYYTRDGYGRDEAKEKTIKRMRNQIINQLDKKSKTTEYSLSEFDKNVPDEEQMEFDGVCIVPKRKVKYDYAVKLSDTLRIENHNKLTPTREFAPYTIDRCERTISMIEEETEKKGMDSRLKMEKLFYLFKLNEARIIRDYKEYNGISINSTWDNKIIDLNDVDELINSMQIKDAARQHLDEYSITSKSLQISYYEFKKAEAIYEKELSNIKSRST